MTWGEITPFCPVCRRCGSLARGISLPLFGEGSTCPTPLVPLRNLRETSRSAVRPGRLRRGPRTTRSVAAPACVVPHGGKESRQRGVAQALPVVPAASGASRSPPAAPVARGLQRRGAGPPDGDLLRARSGARGRSARDPGAAPRRVERFRCRRCRCPPRRHRRRGTRPATRPRRRRRRPRPRPRHRRTRRVPRRSYGRCSTRPRRSPSSGTPLRTMSPRGVPSWAPCARRSTRLGPRPTPPAARRSSTASRSTPSRCRRSRAAGSTRSTRCWPARRRRTTSTRCRRWR